MEVLFEHGLNYTEQKELAHISVFWTHNDNKIIGDFVTENYAIMMYEPLLGEGWPNSVTPMPLKAKEAVFL